jgi:uncharacterized membrane protein YoaK (UPF0700 family)
LELSKRRLYALEALLPLLLCVNAGMVNSFGFYEFGSFVSHMSGHVTHIGIDFLEKDFHYLLGSVLILVGFLIGSITSSLNIADQSTFDRKSTAIIPLSLELLLLFMVFFQLNYTKSTSSTSILGGFLLSMCLGLQNATFRETLGCIIRTTHITGVWTDLGISIGKLIKSHFSTSRNTEKRNIQIQSKNILILSAIVLFFMLGCAIGVIGTHHLRQKFLLVPLGVLILSILAEIKLWQLKGVSKQLP